MLGDDDRGIAGGRTQGLRPEGGTVGAREGQRIAWIQRGIGGDRVTREGAEEQREEERERDGEAGRTPGPTRAGGA
jgi:hypothetical protein